MFATPFGMLTCRLVAFPMAVIMVCSATLCEGDIQFSANGTFVLSSKYFEFYDEVVPIKGFEFTVVWSLCYLN